MRISIPFIFHYISLQHPFYFFCLSFYYLFYFSFIVPLLLHLHVPYCSIFLYLYLILILLKMFHILFHSFHINISNVSIQFNSITFQCVYLCWYWSVYIFRYSVYICNFDFEIYCILPNSMNRRNLGLVYGWLWSQYPILSGYPLKMCNCHIFQTKPCSTISHLLVSWNKTEKNCLFCLFFLFVCLTHLKCFFVLFCFVFSFCLFFLFVCLKKWSI